MLNIKVRFLKIHLILILAFLIFSTLSTISFAEDRIDLIAGQHYDVGDVIVSNDGTNLYIKFQTIFGWSISTTHVHVATNLLGIPQKNGNPIPGQFIHKTDHYPPVSEYEYTILLPDPLPDTGILFIAAHADVCGNSINIPSGTVDLMTEFGVDVDGSSSYLIAYISGLGLDGTYKSYCIEPHNIIASLIPYTSGVISSYDTDEIPNLDLVNFVINQNYVNNGYIFSEVQQAIWMLISGSFKTSDQKIGECDLIKAQKIVDDAYEYRAEHGFYVPPPCGVMALILSPRWELYDDEGIFIIGFDDQKIIIIVPVPCGGCETAWGDGAGFPGKNWGMYFAYDVVNDCIIDPPPVYESSPKGKKK